MNPLHPNAEATVRDYIGSPQVLKVLGWGIEGVVFASPDAMAAIKVHSRREGFERELAVYQRLRKHNIQQVVGFAVPRLAKFHSGLCVIEMSIVKPPWLLDFSSARLDKPPDFSEEVETEWWERLQERFEARLPVVRAVYNELVNRFGIYYGDFKPGNIEFVEDST